MQKSTSVRQLRLENQGLLDQVSVTRLQIMQADKEAKRLRDQLECLQLLVKRAWSGDYEAAIHVAKIVGAAPPLLQKCSETNKLISIPKSRALNNWASLAHGLLNNLNKQYEDVLYVKRREYLLQREDYLDSQLDGYVNEDRYRRDKDLDIMLCIQANQSSETLDSKRNERKNNARPKTAVKRAQSSLMRKTSNPQQNHHSSTHFEELVVQPAGAKTGFDGSFQETKDIRTKPTPHKKTFLRASSAPPTRTTPTKKQFDVKSKKPINRFSSYEMNSHRNNKNPPSKKRPYSASPVIYRKSSVVYRKSYPLQNKQVILYSETTKRQLDDVERELRKTTKALQKKLSLHSSGVI